MQKEYFKIYPVKLYHNSASCFLNTSSMSLEHLLVRPIIPHLSFMVVSCAKLWCGMRWLFDHFQKISQVVSTVFSCDQTMCYSCKIIPVNAFSLTEFFEIRNFEVRNSWVTKSSYEIELRKMASHFQLLTWTFL